MDEEHATNRTQRASWRRALPSVPVLLLACAGSSAQSAESLRSGTFDYVATGQLCVLDNCSNLSAPGRISILGSGKILIYFAKQDRSGVEPNGVLLQLGKSVSLSGRGRLPATVFGGLAPQGGSGSAQFDGRHLTLSVNVAGAGPMSSGGTATVKGRFINIFEVDPSTGSIVSGTGAAQGTIQGVRADGQPFSGGLSGSSTIQMQ